MKRLSFVFAILVLITPSAFAEEIQGQGQAQRPANNAARGQQATPEEVQRQQLNQVRVNVGSYYAHKFREEVGLSDDQVLKLSFFIQSFIDNRFSIAMRQRNITQALEELRRRPNASEAEEEALILQKLQIDRNFVNTETQFIEKIQPELKTGQATRVIQFNKRFFDEILPGLIEQARANAQRGQQALPQNRQNVNPNRQQNGPNRGDAFQNPQNQQNR